MMYYHYWDFTSISSATSKFPPDGDELPRLWSVSGRFGQQRAVRPAPVRLCVSQVGPCESGGGRWGRGGSAGCRRLQGAPLGGFVMRPGAGRAGRVGTRVFTVRSLTAGFTLLIAVSCAQQTHTHTQWIVLRYTLLHCIDIKIHLHTEMWLVLKSCDAITRACSTWTPIILYSCICFLKELKVT